MSVLREKFIGLCEEGDLSAAKKLFAAQDQQEQQAMLAERAYACFRDACKFGHEDIVKWLYNEAEDKQEMLEADDYGGFQRSCRNGYQEIAKWLYNKAENKQEMLEADQYGCFRYTCHNGYIDIAKWLYDLAGSKWAMVSAYSYNCFAEACGGGYEDIANWLYDLVKDKQAILTASEHSCFRQACVGGNLDIAKWLYDQAEDKQAMIAAGGDAPYGYCGFRRACEFGHLDVAKWLYDKAEDKQAMIEVGNYKAFQEACGNGYLNVAKWLYDLAEDKQAMLSADKYYGFKWACTRGHLDTAKWLYDQTEDKQAMLAADKHHGFQWACQHGHLDVAKWVYDQADDKQAMYTANNYAGFRWSCQRSSADIVQWLYNLAEDKQSMLAAEGYQGFATACNHKRHDIIFMLAPLVAACDTSHQTSGLWDKYRSTLHTQTDDFEKHNLPYPKTDKESRITPERCYFDTLAHKLNILKKAFPDIDVTSNLGELNKPKKDKQLQHWRVPWQKIAKAMEEVKVGDVEAIVDTINETASFVAGYAVKQQYTDDTIRRWNADEVAAHIDPIKQVIAKQMLEGRTLVQLKTVSEMWHARRAAIKSGNIEKGITGLRDFAEEGAWHSATKDTEISCTQSGFTDYRLVALTSAADLDEEHNHMGHCVDGYAEDCRKGDFHVFSMQRHIGGNWQRVTTLGCNEVNGELQSPDVGHHQGKDNRTPTVDEQAVANWFIEAFNYGEIDRNKRRGEVVVESERSAFENRIGVTLENLTPERIQQNFQLLAEQNKSRHYLFGKQNKANTFQSYLESIGISSTPEQNVQHPTINQLAVKTELKP